MRTKKERSWTRKVGDASVGVASGTEQEGTIVEFQRLLSPQNQPHDVLGHPRHSTHLMVKQAHCYNNLSSSMGQPGLKSDVALISQNPRSSREP